MLTGPAAPYRHKCKPGGPAFSAEVLESFVQANRNTNHAGRAECGARVDNYNTSEDPGARALSAEVLESGVQADKNKDHAVRRERKGVAIEW